MVEIMAVYVLPDVQSRGIGAGLLREGLSRCRASRVIVEVERDNLPARRFYGMYGFEEIGRRTERLSATSLIRWGWRWS